MFLEPRAGLCNRMRVLDSALKLARRIDAELHVLWVPRFPDMGCAFEDLFEPIAGITSMTWLPDREAAEKALRALPVDRRIGLDEHSSLLAQHFDHASLARYEGVFLQTPHRFYGEPDGYREFVPHPEILAPLDAYGVDRSFVGIHMRRGDHPKGNRVSPTTAFVAFAEKQLEAAPDTRFFVATDSAGDEARLQERFGSRVLVHPKQNRLGTDAASMRDAVTDLYGLSRCCSVAGTYFSSFSETAANIGGIPLEVIHVPVWKQQAPVLPRYSM